MVRKKSLWIFLLCLVTLVAAALWIWTALPSQFHMVEGREESGFLQFPFAVELREDKVMVSEGGETAITENIEKQQTKEAVVTFLGIPMKQAQVHLVPESEVLAGGKVIGIALKTEGLLVLGTGKVETAQGEQVCPASSLLQTGDVILRCNGQVMEEKEELEDAVKDCGGEAMELLVRREDKEETVTVQPVSDQTGQYRLGVWVRDSAQGLGTVTFVDPASGAFGALGHGVYDVDTSALLPAEEGVITESSIVGYSPGESGTPGEMTGGLKKQQQLGEVWKNTEVGVYGKAKESQYAQLVSDAYPIAFRQEVKTGPAQILSDVLGGDVEAYDVEITSVNQNGVVGQMGMVVQITDPRLLESTGGIIQGMSGSPVIQDGKLIGAVTHVFVKDPTKGYGIFIETMLEEAAA